MKGYSGYEWLTKIDPLPVLVAQAMDADMIFESFDADALPLDDWAEETGMAHLDVYHRDDLHPYGALFISTLIQRAGLGMTRDPILASGFRRFGADIISPDRPSLGDVILWTEDVGGAHRDVVGLLIGTDRVCYHALYLANHHNTMIARIPNAAVTAMRRPIYAERPWTAQHVELKADGGLLNPLEPPAAASEAGE